MNIKSLCVTMICDSHVHMGYCKHHRCDGLFYYSPRKIVGVLDRVGVKEFIVSSMTAQFGANYKDLLCEAAEMKRVSKGRAHIFFWMTDALLRDNPNLEFLDTGMFEGVKFHELVTPWFSKMRSCFKSILSELERRSIPVQIHTGNTNGCRPCELEELAYEFPLLRIDFAHFFPAKEIALMMVRHSNIFSDVAMYVPELYARISPEIAESANVMFGSDIPAYHEVVRAGYSLSYRQRIKNFSNIFDVKKSEKAFWRFLGKGEY